MTRRALDFTAGQLHLTPGDHRGCGMESPVELRISDADGMAAGVVPSLEQAGVGFIDESITGLRGYSILGDGAVMAPQTH